MILSDRRTKDTIFSDVFVLTNIIKCLFLLYHGNLPIDLFDL
jgi:hypothetical protein